MAKTIKQYRYYKANSAQNQPQQIEDIHGNIIQEGINHDNLAHGGIFFNEPNLGAITQLGIQSLPGVKFSLNRSADSIILGPTGIYELNVENIADIFALQFDSDTLKLIENNANAYLIVDAVYNKEE